MAEAFTMPKLGLTMTDGTIREWLVTDGTEVQAGDPVLVIETDKVETEIEARTAGILRVTGVVGSTYACGDVIGFIFDDRGDAEAAQPAAPVASAFSEAAEPAAPVPAAFSEATEPAVPVASAFSEATLGDTEPAQLGDRTPSQQFIDEVNAVGGMGDEALDAVPAAAPAGPVDEASTDQLMLDGFVPDEPATIDLDDLFEDTIDEDAIAEPADADRPIEGGDALVDQVAAYIAQPSRIAAPEIAVTGVGGRVLASPRARRAAEASGLALATIAGTGPGGRIVHDDVADAIEAARVEAARVEAERLEAERLEAERLEAERLEAERLEAERLEAERLEAERLEAERLEAERLEAERLEAARAEAERVEAERVEAERLAAERAEAAPIERGMAEPPAAEPPAAEPSSTVAPAAEPPAKVPAAALPPDTTPSPTAPPAERPPAATGGARLLADFLGVPLAEVPAASGRITREDVGRYVRLRLGAPVEASAAPSAPTSTGAARAASAPLLQEPAEVIPMAGMRGIIAERMHTSLSSMAQLTLSVDVDMTGVNAERERRRVAGGVVPGYTAWVVAAAAQAIEGHGYVNSQVTDAGLALLPDVHVGVAVALDEGLIVPVIEHANLRTVEETHSVVADLAGRARNGKLQFSELEGATFSVTALGMFGVDMFTPVINPPNTAILGVGRLRSETAWQAGEPSERTMMTLSLTWDHRAFDGAPAAEFAQTIVRLLESPTELV
ncbi:MAG: 2-oxo acid dehydrogenase subunit E2 [Actinomycetota bacterium]